MRRFICFIICYLAIGVSLEWLRRGADRDFERLLGGSDTIAIVGLQIMKSERISLEDTAVLAYVSEMFRAAVQSNSYDGAEFFSQGPYDVRAALSTGRVAHCSIYVARGGGRLLVMFPTDTLDDPGGYLVTLRAPIPEQFFDAMRTACGAVRGANRN